MIAVSCHNKKIKSLIADIARYQFVRKPAATITDIHAGVPSQHIAFWSKMAGGMLYDIYSDVATHNKVMSMIADTETGNANEERVLGYLRKFIGDLLIFAICDWNTCLYR